MKSIRKEEEFQQKIKYVLKNGMFKRSEFKSLINIYIYKVEIVTKTLDVGRWTFYQRREINLVLKIVKKYL